MVRYRAHQEDDQCELDQEAEITHGQYGTFKLC
jgi:hypothetical protein